MKASSSGVTCHYKVSSLELGFNSSFVALNLGHSKKSFCSRKNKTNDIFSAICQNKYVKATLKYVGTLKEIATFV